MAVKAEVVRAVAVKAAVTVTVVAVESARCGTSVEVTAEAGEGPTQPIRPTRPTRPTWPKRPTWPAPRGIGAFEQEVAVARDAYGTHHA
eukprot:1435221-Prymnesium_polylepis.1